MPNRNKKPNEANEQKPYARSRRKNNEARADLQPLNPGERPRAVTIAAALAAVFGITNVVFWIVGWQVQGEQPRATSVIAFTVVMFVAAIFMWRGAYWAVLGFQALLAITVVVAGLSLMVASNVWAATLCALTLIGAGLLFWYLIRAMARLQMPRRTQHAAPRPPDKRRVG